jgi:hypothetical protein
VSLFVSCWICALVLKSSSLVVAAVFLELARSPVSSLRGAFLSLVPSLANGLVFFLLTADPTLSSCLAPRLKFIFSLIFQCLGLWSILQVVPGAARLRWLAPVHRRIQFCSRLFLCLCTTFIVWFYRCQSVSPPWALHLRVFPTNRLHSTDTGSIRSCFS